MIEYKRLKIIGVIACLQFALFGRAAEGGDAAAKPLPPGIQRLDAPGIRNLFALGPNILSGSSPEGEPAFAALKQLGVRTILSVDGAKPDVETARKYGLRYVHFPHGYDGISTNLQLRLIKAAQTLPGPIFVHCHHGRHRGPTAAAVICMAREGWSPARAESWLTTAGTATNYTGLYEVVRTFQPPTPDQLLSVPAEFPETSKVSGLVELMVSIDDRWDHLKLVRAAGYRVPKEHPDIKPANEALILWEHYREAQRLPEAARLGADFLERLRTAEEEARKAERLLHAFGTEADAELRPQLDATFDAMAKSCSTCHKAYRDTAGTKALP